MKVLVLGSGAREHALGARLTAEGWTVTVAPGNAGIARAIECRPLDLADVPAAVALATALGVDLAVVGPEAPLVAGLADALRAAGIATFGPSAAAARLEGSKAFAKDVMEEAGVPTAAHRVFTDAAEARAHARAQGGKVVVKVDGIAQGKGVVVSDSLAMAEHAINAALVRGEFGEAGRRLVIEERLVGPEVSLLCLCDGRLLAALPIGHDYKRLRDGDRGPNTGGMGAVCPSPRAGGREGALVDLCVRPIVEALARRGTPFNGVIYAGLMLTADGPRVLEYNCRFGDPETQVLVGAVAGPWGEALHGVARGALDASLLRPSGRHAVGVVVAAEGYPGAPVLGDEIRGLEAAEQLGPVYAGGVGSREGKLVTAGGRVLTVVGIDLDPAAARTRAYAALAEIAFTTKVARTDIGAEA